MSTPGTLLSFGHGYSAQALAARLIPLGWQVIATTRRPEARAAIAATGATPLVWPGCDLAPALARASHVLSSVPPVPGQGDAPSGGDPVLEGAGAALAQARHLTWMGYLSTTGVYGDHAGGWVDEDTPTAPGAPRSAARVAAEAAWTRTAAAAGVPLTVFRLAGIYGPGRSPFDTLRAGTARAIVKPGQVFSRIHVDDIAQAIAAAMARPTATAVVNLADDLSAPPQEVIWHAADLAGLPRPPAIPFDAADLGAMARSFYAECRRTRNDRLKSALGVRLIHPDYRSGLAAILRAGG
ncbi:SDR family oxidoreductase [Rhodobaculum claviforme]|uniref:NAD(P)-dependent oxidoreductase n=1 Tax=Rhodobaculum claviforme TaxID=1549854 RepID=A0A934WIX0_9RHOB|nr:SDR family oxidoreductase [Rhodobaculum claviforme]MBK5927302.1 NAD(P)-dependent oxidoreductase [Rhodobaculum claviforme]